MTWPPSGVNLTAFDSRLSTICLSRRASAIRRMPWAMSALSVSCLSSARAETTRMASLSRRPSANLRQVEPDAAGLDLRHVEDVVDHVEQVLPALVDVAAILAVFLCAERAEHARLHDLGESDDGIERRAQLMAHIGEELRLGLVGLLGPGLLLGIFVGEVGELVGLVLQRLLRGAQVRNRPHQPLLALHQPFFVRLDGGDVGADRDIAAVLGAPLADVQPAAVVELRLEGARARQLAFARRPSERHDRLAPGFDDRLVGRCRT